jgi:Mrp family chromosome partitioning ATPase
MNEPLKNQPFPPAQPEGSYDSLIQRAMNAFDRGQFVPPSGPADFLPNAVHPAAQPQPPQGYAVQPPQGYAPQQPVQPQAYAPQYAPQQPPMGYAPQPMVAPVAPAPAYGDAPQYAPQYAPAPQNFHRINYQKLNLEGFATPGSAPSAQLEEFRIVKRQLLEQAEDLRRQGAGVEAQTILVTSANPEEGKTFCAINLALSIAAEKDTEVVLVDLDLARASVLSTLGLPAGPGFVDAIADPRFDVRDFVMQTDLPGLKVLGGGRPTSSDAEYLASARARAVLEQLVTGKPNRIVVFDTPPVLSTSIAAEVAKLAGQAVLVVRADKTAGNAVQDAAGLLSACPNVQALLNGVQFSPSGRRFGTYHNYRG